MIMSKYLRRIPRIARRPFAVMTGAALSAIIACSTGAWPAQNAFAALDPIDYAPQASTNVTIVGPNDLQFAKLEGRYWAPLASSHWRGFCQRLARDITITLPQPETVSAVSLEFEQQPKIGIFYPDKVTFEVYYNGRWLIADKVTSTIAPWAPGNTTETITGNLGNVQVSMIRIHFPVFDWVFARELHIWGYQPEPALNLNKLQAVPTFYNQPLTTQDQRDYGIHNMLLAYTDGTNQTSVWTEQDFLPMTGYIDRQGQTAARMFDSVLFLPTGRLPDTQSAWQGFIDNLFQPGQQLAALNQAVGQTNADLGVTDPNALGFHENVVIGIPHPDFGSGVWSTVNGNPISFDGSINDPGAVQAREQALQWYIVTLLNRWKQAGFNNLNLAGLYWINERVDFQQPDDSLIVQDASQMTLNNQLPLFWIPYFDASGIDGWNSYGFSAAWLQPNYLAVGNLDPRRIPSAIQLAKLEGMGIEIEAPQKLLESPQYRSLYEQMLRTFTRSGMGGDVSHVYYAGSQVLVQAAESTNPAIRGVYDATYKFVSGQ